MAEERRRRKREEEEEAEEWERRKRGRRKRRKRRRRRGGEEDPVDVLGEEVMGRVMELLDARSVARCTAVSRAWRGVAADDRLWAPKCAELMAGKAHIPRLTMIPTASKLSTYSMAIADGKRTRITKEDLCDHDWEFRFTIAAPEYWRNLDPSWKHTGPPMRRYFHPDGYHSADPHDAVWGGHECTYTIITSFAGNGCIRDHYVRINRWPPMKVSRKEDWSWELSNHLYRYNSIPDTDKKGCTGPLFPVW
ncbi:uncharacterized protein [Oryza sativa Japonica Group]|uniref:F-box domain-containing protein n=3 Tax=Oryza TaxID=4527 RepID=A3BH02_ORYSJ|nr:uncharacterized protein LOC4342511 isoform X1 [Oryza sativa Japonica Group]EAZ02918.1 hypothetical protein OsI_25057 [Oryza sativa Indica Group]EAZ38841.1 hypothetical protein OsJ_23257 [Oryza sativa Japonica Group]KAF2921610.1 hypothetical protein DAI22_07g047700 [Oryza sativa Japonica Group]USI00525.1 F-box domain-containing protein [Oryza sativa Japonica Group]